MKKIIMLGLVLVTMLLSLGGCYYGHPYPDHDRSGGHHRSGGHDRDRGGGYYMDGGHHERR